MSVHICTGVNRRFIAQVRRHGCRIWQTASTHQTRHAAIIAMAKMFSASGAKRGRVLMTADCYDPIIVVEMQK